MSRWIILALLLSAIHVSSAQSPDAQILIKEVIIQFDHDKSDLKDNMISRLDEFIIGIDTLNKPYVTIEAHTDNSGSDSYNEVLSATRAASIRNYLVDIGISQSIVSDKAFGESLALTSNLTEKGRAMNRRAHVRLYHTLLSKPQLEEPIKPKYTPVVVSGRTVKAESGEALIAKVEVKGKSFDGQTKSDSTGYFEIEVPKGAVLKFISTPDAADFFPSTLMTKIVPDVINEGVVLVSEYLKTVTVSGTLIDENGIALQNGIIYFQWGEMINQTTSDEEGYFEMQIPEDEPVRISAFLKEYFYDGAVLKGDTISEAIKLELPKIEEGRRYVADDILFVGDRDVVLPTSQIHLQSLKKVIQMADGYCFKIEGHINQPRSPKVKRTSQNFQLSEKRAERIYNFLKMNGVTDERICFEGFGNWRMRFPNARSEKEMRLNRRVEVQVIPCE